MQKLKCEVVTNIKVEYGDLERFISEVINAGMLPEVTWRGNYQIVAYQEWGNYESHELDITKEWVEKYPPGEFELKDLAAGKIMFQLETIMTLMAQKEIIPFGNYLVNVSW